MGNINPPTQPYYLKPGPLGGRLIRELIQFLRAQGVLLPISSHILIAISGGSDSVGLAHLLIHYGRKIAPRCQFTLLHINHQWRGKESDLDSEFIEQLGRDWEVPVIIKKIKPPKHGGGESWEAEARTARKEVYKTESDRLQGAIVITAHHSDDLAETLLWRLFTGAAKTHGGGVAFRHGVEMRPALRVRKTYIRDYLNEVGQKYHEDPTNHADRFLRARMRGRLMLEIENLFPRAIDHLTKIALDAQEEERYFVDDNVHQQVDSSSIPIQVLLKATGLRVRRSHLEIILEKMIPDQSWQGELHLPGGWKLTREKKRQKESAFRLSGGTSEQSLQKSDEGTGSVFERWILEKNK